MGGGGPAGDDAPPPVAGPVAPPAVLAAAAGYVVSLPERLIRAAAGVVGGVLKEGGELLLPPPVRCSSFYEGLVGGLQRWLIRDLGGVEGVVAGASADDDFAHRAVGNVLDAAGLLAVHASPLLVIGVAADLVKGGQVVLGELVADLKREGIVEPGAGATLDAVLDGVHGVVARIARKFQAPPLSRAELAEVAGDLRVRIQALAAGRPIEAAEVGELLADLRGAAREQRRPLWDVAAAVAQAVGVAAGTGARVARERVLAPWLDQFARLRRDGFAAYWSATSAPYVAALARRWRPDEPTVSARWLTAAVGWIARRLPTRAPDGDAG